MKTYPFETEGGIVKAFEISNAFPWSLGAMRSVLESVAGVTGFRRNWFNEDRFSFVFLGRACVVNEPWGDNSRYWIGPTEMEPSLDMGPVHEAFRRFRVRLTFDREFRA
jgi:hypothetical protein